ncbi:MAG: alpha/beta hydrolase [Pseudomonadota bacterium]
MRTPPFINLREWNVGGGVLTEPEIDLGRLQRARRMVLLIHGFNTTKPEAFAGYQSFIAELTRKAPRIAAQACPVYWPGDSSLKGAGYPWLVGRARECAQHLARFLSSRRGEVIIIAHSLGCRLAIETMDLLRDAEERPSIRLFLMAAAVPVHKVSDQNAFAPGIAAAATTDVLHSGADGVLAYWFRIGQLAAPGEGALLPEAVGLHGRPGAPVWSRVAEMKGYEHGAYWAGLETAAHVSNRLGGPVAKPRPGRLVARIRLPMTRPAPEARPGPTPRMLEKRRLHS